MNEVLHVKASAPQSLGDKNKSYNRNPKQLPVEQSQSCFGT